MPVVRHGFLRREPEDQPAEGLVFHLLDRIAHQVPAEQDVGQLEVAVEDELPDLGQGLGAALDDRGIRPARPVGLLVELDLLLVGLAEDHGPEPAVADGQGVLPLVGGVAVPKPRRGIGPGRGLLLGRGPGRKARDERRQDGEAEREGRDDGAADSPGHGLLLHGRVARRADVIRCTAAGAGARAIRPGRESAALGLNGSGRGSSRRRPTWPGADDS